MQRSQYHLQGLLSGLVTEILYWVPPSETCFNWAPYHNGMKHPQVVDGETICRWKPMLGTYETGNTRQPPP
jgi:hypothetical protein